MQLLALFILRTTLQQCENLTDGILIKRLNISKDELKNLIQLLHNEHVIRYKYAFQCPKCGEMDTVFENELTGVPHCSFCNSPLNVTSIINSATIRYVLDKDDFVEYMQENYKNELESAKRGEEPKLKIIPIKTKTLAEGRNMENTSELKKECKLFISHATKDATYVSAFVEFLEALGMPDNSIFCSCIEGYGIPWGENIYDYLCTEFTNINKELIVIFMLSDNFYDRVSCLNEMGASWALKKEYRSILLPGFNYRKIEGAIDPNNIGVELGKDNLRYQLNEIKHQMTDWFHLKSIEDNKWDRIRDNFINKIKQIELASNKGTD